jgi:hypothetical protein
MYPISSGSKIAARTNVRNFMNTQLTLPVAQKQD